MNKLNFSLNREFQKIASLFLFAFMWGVSFAQSADSLAQVLADTAEMNYGKECIPFLEEAFFICENRDCSDTTLARLYHRKGVAYFQGYIDDNLAIAYTDTAILLYVPIIGENNKIVANEYFNLASMKYVIGNNIEAKKDILLAIELIEESDMSSSIDSIYANWYDIFSRINNKLGDFQQAKIQAKKALYYCNAFYKQPSHKRFQVLNILGLINMESDDYENALFYYKEALLEEMKIGGLVGKFQTAVLGNIGYVLLKMGELTEAEEVLLSQLYKINIDFTNNFSNTTKEKLSNSHANLLQLYIQKQDWPLAEENYQEGLRLLLEVDSTGRLPRFAELYFKKAKLEHGQGRYTSSLAYLEQAMQVVAPQLATTGVEENITILGSFKQVLEILGFRAAVQAAQGDLQAALLDVELLNRLVTQSRRSYQSSLSKYFLLQKVVPIYELGIQINRQLYRQTGQSTYLEQAYAYNARNKAILLLESLQSDRAMTFAGLPAEVQEQENTLRDALTEQERQLYNAYQKESELDSLQNLVYEKESVYHKFIQDLERDYSAYYQLKYSANTPPATSEIQENLAEGQALIEYFVGHDSIYTFIVEQERFDVQAQAVPIAFQDSVILFRELMTNGIAADCETQFIRLSRYFYNLLLASPLEQLSEESNRLVIIPDGLLNFLSFEALLYRPIDQLRGADGFVIEKYACSYAYSSRLLLEEQFYPRSASKGFVGFGLEYDDHTLNYLKDLEYNKIEAIDTTFQLPCAITDTTRYLGKLAYSDDEVRNIATLTQGDSWLNETVTKQAFLDNSNDYRLLHLAMHGNYDLEFPMNSSLIFTRTDSSDVFLRAAEIYGLELTGEMVVLSACNTAFGKLQAGEGAMTLARAFHYAGIPSVVGSLWSIPDHSASTIMRLFYEQLDEGLPKDIALQNAKLAYLDNSDWSSPATRQPVHWAPSVVIGSVAPVSISKKTPWLWWLLGGVVILFGGLTYRYKKG